MTDSTPPRSVPLGHHLTDDGRATRTRCEFYLREKGRRCGRVCPVSETGETLGVAVLVDGSRTQTFMVCQEHHDAATKGADA